MRMILKRRRIIELALEALQARKAALEVELADLKNLQDEPEEKRERSPRPLAARLPQSRQRMAHRAAKKEAAKKAAEARRKRGKSRHLKVLGRTT